jgi:hypothetical protein
MGGLFFLPITESMPAKLCSKCQTRPKVSRQPYCRQCYNAYVREYRSRKRIAQGKPPVQSRQPVQRPAVEDVPDTVNVRIVGNGNGWSVAVRKDNQWICVFRSDDREEALLVLGATFGADLRDSH